MKKLSLFLTALCAAGLAAAEVRIAPHLNNVTPDGVTFSWETTEPAAGTVTVTGPDGSTATAELKEAGKINLLRVEGLKPDARHSYTLTTGGETFSATFMTAPDKPRPITFIAIGDSRRWNVTVQQTEMIQHMLQWEPEFFLINGDLVGNGHDYDQWTEHFDRFEEITKSYMVVTARGNHEGSVLKDVENDWFGKYHELPGEGEPFASFTWGNSHFAVLSWEQTVFPNYQPETAKWLNEHLAGVDSQYTFVGQHFPIYCTGYMGADDPRKETSENMSYERDIIEEHGVDVFISGHTHIYERLYPIKDGKRDDEHGTLHVINGGDMGANYPDWWSAVTDDAATMEKPTYTVFFCRDDAIELRHFAWGKEVNRFLEVDRVILYEDESMPKAVLAGLDASTGAQLIENIESLGAMMYQPAAPAVAAHLDDTNPDVRRAAASALAAIGAGSVTEDLLAYVTDSDPVVRQKAARAIEIAMPESMGEAVAGQLEDVDSLDTKVAMALIGALQFHADPGVAREALWPIVSSDADDELRRRASYALTRVVTEEDVPALANQFEQETSTYVMVRLAFTLNQLTGKRMPTDDDSAMYRSAPGDERKQYTQRWLEG